MKPSRVLSQVPCVSDKPPFACADSAGNTLLATFVFPEMKKAPEAGPRAVGLFGMRRRGSGSAGLVGHSGIPQQWRLRWLLLCTLNHVPSSCRISAASSANRRAPSHQSIQLYIFLFTLEASLMSNLFLHWHHLQTRGQSSYCFGYK